MTKIVDIEDIRKKREKKEIGIPIENINKKELKKSDLSEHTKRRFHGDRRSRKQDI